MLVYILHNIKCLEHFTQYMGLQVWTWADPDPDSIINQVQKEGVSNQFF